MSKLAVPVVHDGPFVESLWKAEMSPQYAAFVLG